MSLLGILHSKHIIHAVVKNEDWEIDDWFVLCHKKQMKNVYFTVQGVIEIDGIQIFAINMKKKDVHEFFILMANGFYYEAFQNCSGTVYELTNNGFKNYITKIPLNRARLKKWKTL